MHPESYAGIVESIRKPCNPDKYLLLEVEALTELRKRYHTDRCELKDKLLSKVAVAGSLPMKIIAI